MRFQHGKVMGCMRFVIFVMASLYTMVRQWVSHGKAIRWFKSARHCVFEMAKQSQYVVWAFFCFANFAR